MDMSIYFDSSDWGKFWTSFTVRLDVSDEIEYFVEIGFPAPQNGGKSEVKLEYRGPDLAAAVARMAKLGDDPDQDREVCEGELCESHLADFRSLFIDDEGGLEKLRILLSTADKAVEIAPAVQINHYVQWWEIDDGQGNKWGQEVSQEGADAFLRRFRREYHMV